MSIQQEGKKLEVKQADELAAFYQVPKSLMNAFFVEIGLRSVNGGIGLPAPRGGISTIIRKESDP